MSKEKKKKTRKPTLFWNRASIVLVCLLSVVVCIGWTTLSIGLAMLGVPEIITTMGVSYSSSVVDIVISLLISCFALALLYRFTIFVFKKIAKATSKFLASLKAEADAIKEKREEV